MVVWELQTCLVVSGGEHSQGFKCMWEGLVLRFTAKSSQVSGGKLL